MLQHIKRKGSHCLEIYLILVAYVHDKKASFTALVVSDLLCGVLARGY